MTRHVDITIYKEYLVIHYFIFDIILTRADKSPIFYDMHPEICNDIMKYPDKKRVSQENMFQSMKHNIRLEWAGG